MFSLAGSGAVLGRSFVFLGLRRRNARVFVSLARCLLKKDREYQLDDNQQTVEQDPYLRGDFTVGTKLFKFLFEEIDFFANPYLYLLFPWVYYTMAFFRPPVRP